MRIKAALALSLAVFALFSFANSLARQIQENKNTPSVIVIALIASALCGCAYIIIRDDK